jgi:NADH:ubiquinone oxidoreductase subunit E
MNLQDIIFLIGSYLSISDGEINEKEHKLLHHLCHPSDEAVHLQSLIFSDAEDKISLKELVQSYHRESKGDNTPLLDILFQAENADGYADPKEDAMIDQVAKLLKVPKTTLENYRSRYAGLEHGAQEDIKLSWSDSLNAAFRSLVIEVKSEKEDDDNYAELLSGATFAKKVKDIARVSQQDLDIAEDIMVDYNSRIQAESAEIDKNILQLKQTQRKDKEIESLVEEIVKMNDWIRKDVRQALRDNLEVLDKKKRTINYFTIAFMGRTKAGKSTFHKVVTHEEDDDIGVGKLRTTRYNRSFYWENLRIVDTPGIGAPGGKTDTETASSIIDEADLICYIVTDDSIQTTEFDFLRPLKERSKPLFIILNILGSLYEEPRLKKFLKDPLRWRNEKGVSDIQGHYDRINEIIGDKYDMSMVEIIPLQLQAAILMNEPGRFSDEEKSQLLLGSNIQEYVRKVKMSIYKTGSLKKTQNIYDGCAYQINQVKSELVAKRDAISRRIEMVDKSLDSILSFVDKEKVSVESRIDTAISTAFQRLRNNAARFSELYYNEKKDLSSKWNNYPDNKRAYSSLTNTLNKISSDFHESVQDRINECLDDINYKQENYFKANSGGDIKGQRIVDYKFGANIVGALITGGAPFYAGPILALFISNPAGWMVAAFTVVVGLITWGISSLFNSKAKKIAEAKEKLKNELLKTIDDNEVQMKSDFKGEFFSKIEGLKTSLDGSFRFVSTQSKIIVKNLDKLIDLSEENEQNMESMFAYRILQYLRVFRHFENEENIIKRVRKKVSVIRSYGDSTMTIEKPSAISQDMLDLASQVTQIKIIN